MALHDDLLSLARRLVDHNPAAPVEADLRRAVSTAYYALFHLLVYESTAPVVAIPGMRVLMLRYFLCEFPGNFDVSCLLRAGLQDHSAQETLQIPGNFAILSRRIAQHQKMRARVVRAFEHRDMRKVCEDYSRPVHPTGQPVLQGIQNIAAAFLTLQQARFDADYNTAIPLVHADADASVQLGERAFADWATVQKGADVDVFLTDLLFQSIRKR